MMKTYLKKILQSLKIISLIVLIVNILNCNILYAEESGGVLVTAKNSSVKEVSRIELRRIYLGLSSSGNSIVNPVINISDMAIYKAFLKNVMHMTEKGYRRKIVKRVFRQGTKNIKEITSQDELVKYLQENVNDVSFMDSEIAKKTRGIKVVQSLW